MTITDHWLPYFRDRPSVLLAIAGRIGLLKQPENPGLKKGPKREKPNKSGH
jgi:hypothetical protein